MAQHAHVVDTRQRLCTQGFQAAFIHHHHGRSAVADLAGVGRADHATFLQQLDARDALQRRVGAHAFVLRVQLAQRTGFGTAGLHRHDLARPVLTGLRRTLVALQGIGIQFIAAQAVFARHLLGAAELAEHHTGVTLLHLFADVAPQARFVSQAVGREHGHTAHAFDPTGNHHIHAAAHHGLRGKVQRLLG